MAQTNRLFTDFTRCSRKTEAQAGDQRKPPFVMHAWKREQPPLQKKGMKLCPDPSSLQTKAIGRRIEKLVAPREQVKTTVTEIKVKKQTKTLYF